MNKIILTQHVKKRREKGNIPEELLEQLGHHILEQHPMDTAIDGVYKFRKSGTCAVFGKKGNNYTFITLYGATGYLLSADEFGTFNCKYQDPEITKAKAQKRAKKQ